MTAPSPKHSDDEADNSTNDSTVYRNSWATSGLLQPVLRGLTDRFPEAAQRWFLDDGSLVATPEVLGKLKLYFI